MIEVRIFTKNYWFIHVVDGIENNMYSICPQHINERKNYTFFIVNNSAVHAAVN